jgi:hypothetical protein
MARNSVTKRKKPMATAAARPSRARKAAEDKLVDDMMKISRRVLANVPAKEREQRLAKLNDFLTSLDETVAKQA